MTDPVFSCIIPVSAKDAESQNLKDLIASIRAQDFPQDKIEILVMGEEYGDSEQAKAEGIRKATGEICAMFCADNKLVNKWTFEQIKNLLDKNEDCVGVYSQHYAAHEKGDNSLNRYFALIGANDPIAFYLDKADRLPHYERDWSVEYSKVYFMHRPVPSLGDNGFFWRSEIIKRTNLGHYYPMDNSNDVQNINPFYIRLCYDYVWHRTSNNLITFLKKRYCYARDLYCDRRDRRWKMLGTKEDYWRLLLFVIATLTIIQPVLVSCRGYRKVNDWAWFWHWPVCAGFLFTYGLLAVRNLFKHGQLFQCRQHPSLSPQ